MNEVLVVLTLLAEVLMILYCIHASFKQKVRFDKLTIGIIVIECLLYFLINSNMLPTICTIIVYIILIVYCYLRFQLPVDKTLGKFILGLVLAAMFEVVTAGIVIPLQGYVDIKIITFLASVVALLLCCIGLKRITQNRKKHRTLKFRSLIWGVLLFILAFGTVLTEYYVNKTRISLCVALIMFFLWQVYVYIYKLEQSHSEIAQKTLELELQKVYGGAYTELIDEIRKRQHDYKNQLSAIYSMHLVAGSLEELIVMQKAYGSKLIENCKYDNILTCCENPILAGYIYHRCITCEKMGINVMYDIYVGKEIYGFSLHEIIEILGILIENACENVINENMDFRCIQLSLRQDVQSLTFSVSNPAKYLTSTEIEQLFFKGYSTKGNNRGIGLARVLELVKRNNTEIKVTNNMREEMNWISFSIDAINSKEGVS